MKSKQGTQTKALMFADANFLAHVSRVLEIGKVLRDEYQYHVRIAGNGPYLKLVEDAGFEIDYAYTVAKETTLELARRASWMNPVWWQRTVDKSIRSDVEAIRRFNPDVVVGDMHWSLKASSVECGVPYVSIVNGAWTQHMDYQIKAFDDHFLTTLLGFKRATASLTVLKKHLMGLWAFPYRTWKKRGHHDDVNVNTLFDVLEGDYSLICDVPEFCPTKDLPKNMQYVGPILWSPPMDPPKWLDDLDPDRPTIYVSMGSTGKKSFFEISLEAFADTDYQVVMTTGEIDLKSVKAPDNFYVTNFAPGLAIMEKSDCVINHGGNGTIYQALTAGVPIVGIPTHIDQQIQLQLCERMGVGRKMREKTISAQMLKASIDVVVHDSAYQLNAGKLAKAVARYDGARMGARAIDIFLHGEGSRKKRLRKAS